MSLIVDIEKTVGSFHLKTSFTADKEILSLLGASGCGKSMTLKCIAGIMKPDKGRIELNGKVLFDSEKKIDLKPQDRHVGLLFQSYALFPSMTVLGNLKAGCRKGTDKGKIEKMIQQYTEMFELTDLLTRYPHELSGGQQQRVAIARILLSEPDVLLLDEPFSALDSYLRFKVEREMLDILLKVQKPVLLVSHDRDEVYRMSDRIAVMNNGCIDVIGEKTAVFKAPKTVTAATLTGCKNIAPCTVISQNRISVPAWGMELSTPDFDGEITHVGIRMHDLVPVSVSDDSTGNTENIFRCSVSSVLENPFSFVIQLRAQGNPEASTVGWETEKEIWKSMESDTVAIALPKENLLLLTDHNSQSYRV